MSVSALAALFLHDGSGAGSHRLVLPPPGQAASPQELAEQALESAGLLQGPPRPGPVGLEANGWQLTARGLRALQELLLQHDLWLESVQSTNPHTLVAAAGLGLEARPPWPAAPSSSSSNSPMPEGRAGELVVHRGTLRSGDHLQTAGSLLVLGDVNPGARLSAGGHVLVWGRLRGLAHAGTGGDRNARIVALQLRPLQLRIAGAVARGPEEAPPEGLAEQARLVGEVIRLEPAPPQWPLNA